MNGWIDIEELLDSSCLGVSWKDTQADSEVHSQGLDVVWLLAMIRAVA